MKIFLLDTTAFSDKDIRSGCLLLMSPARLEKIERFRYEKDKNLSLGAGYLMHLALAEEGVDYKNARIVLGEMQKPALLDHPDIRFNLSHSGERVMMALSDVPVGCDVEKITHANMKLAKRFFGPAEYEYVKAGEDAGDQDERFFRVWTLKESYIKATGRGISENLPSFDICFEKDGSISLSKDHGTGFEKSEGVYFDEPFMENGYKYSVCSLGKRDSIEIVRVEF